MNILSLYKNTFQTAVDIDFNIYSTRNTKGQGQEGQGSRETIWILHTVVKINLDVDESWIKTEFYFYFHHLLILLFFIAYS